MHLDKNQEKAVKHWTGPAIVVAGPGSGKTTVITQRIINLILTHNIPPAQILSIAFNRKAVEEMERRITQELVQHNAQSDRMCYEVPFIRTLHAFGKDIITENYKQAGFENQPQIWSGKIDRIISEEKQQIHQTTSWTNVCIYKIENKITGKCYIGQTTNPERRKREHFTHSSNDRLRQAIRAEGAKHFSFKVLEQVNGIEGNRREAYWIKYCRDLGEVFNRADPMRQQFSNQLMLEMFCQHFNIQYTDHLDKDPDFEDLNERFSDIKSAVMRAKRLVQTGLFDPNSLTNPVTRAFAIKYETLKAEANSVDFEDMIIQAAHLLETHDTLCQHYREKYPYVLVDEFQDIAPIDFRLISQLSENLFTVGDDDQAIYSFRGGNSQIMQQFAKQSNVRRYEIARNYRSNSTIVEHARALIERNTPRIRKNLRSHNPTKQEITIIDSTPATASKLILEQIAEPIETAILVRTNYEVHQIETIISGDRTTSSAQHAVGGNSDSRSPFEHVQISTIHTAKGREWEKVILVHNTLDRRFPRRDDSIAEERRVLYVAMTRAKKKLVILGGECLFVPEFENIPKNIGYYYRQLMYWHARRKMRKS